MVPSQVYQECLSDIDAISSLLATDSQRARERLMEMKAKWIFWLTSNRGTEVEKLLEEAITRLPRANTAPYTWPEQLQETRGHFMFALQH